MNSVKAIIIGTSASGKTALVRYLRSHTKLPIEEIDENLTEKNGGVYPSDPQYKREVIVPQVIKDVLNRDNIVYLTNTDYFTLENLQEARMKEFIIIQINVPLSELERRNSHRMENEGYDDLSIYFKDMLEYQEMVKQAGLVDHVIDGTLSTESMAKEVAQVVSHGIKHNS